MHQPGPGCKCTECRKLKSIEVPVLKIVNGNVVAQVTQVWGKESVTYVAGSQNKSAKWETTMGTFTTFLW